MCEGFHDPTVVNSYKNKQMKNKNQDENLRAEIGVHKFPLGDFNFCSSPTFIITFYHIKETNITP